MVVAVGFVEEQITVRRAAAAAEAAAKLRQP